MKVEESLAGVPEHLQEAVREAVEAFAYAVCGMAIRAETPEELLKAAHAMAGKMGNAATYGSSSESMPPSARRELLAGMVGASMVFTLGRERMLPEADLSKFAPAHKFLVLVSDRVGTLTPDSWRESMLRLRPSEGEKNWTYKYEYNGE